MDNKNISEIFNRFADKEIQVIETEKTLNVGKKSYTFKEARAVQDEPTLKEMAKTAKEHGLRLRIWFPDTVGTMDYDTSRVNVRIAPDEKGKYRVCKKFSVG